MLLHSGVLPYYVEYAVLGVDISTVQNDDNDSNIFQHVTRWNNHCSLTLMKRSQSCDDLKDNDIGDDNLIPGLPNEIAYHIMKYLLPRSAGAFACVSTSWETCIPRNMVVCFANALVPRARRYPAIFDVEELGNIAVLAREAIREWSLKKTAVANAQTLATDIWDNLQGVYGEMYHFPSTKPNHPVWILYCTICDKPLHKHSSWGVFTVVREPIGGRTTHEISMQFHETCTHDEGVERYLKEQIGKLFARIAADRYRIARPRGMYMKMDEFRDLPDDRLNMYIGPDHMEQIAFWDFLREYPPT